ncbi:disulfide bond formation protein B [Azorhizobium doebereinerae]|uniref:disulfide bond formation protein B n=1 Tax=Azorhizobium doebereinerae TaxID=281091 RepID=UPI00040884BB|nr:disulfide bond formation protein B [Azorhizobium doebereinerae]
MTLQRFLCSLLRSPAAVALVVALGAAFALASAWFFQLVVGLAPCPLCLDQRLPYYAAVPIGLLLALVGRSRPEAARLGLWLLAALMAVDAGIAIYHAGVEWRFWEGPTACTGTAPPMVSDIMSALKSTRVPRCDEAAWRLFGVSMAGWNALLALGLAGVAVLGATRRR